MTPENDVKDNAQADTKPEARPELGQIELTPDGGVSKTILTPAKPGAQPGPSHPRDGMEVSVHYVGTLLDGTQFDSSREKNEPFGFTVGQGSVIKGWDVGVKSMAVGEKCHLFCTAPYAYGADGSGEKIPPGATLRFEVELLSAALPTVTDDGLVKKEVLRRGEGYETPNLGAVCDVRLSAEVAGGAAFSSREGELVADDELEPCGLTAALKSMKRGEKTRFFIEPGLQHFSPEARPEGVCEGDVLVYEIEMVGFEKKKEIYLMTDSEKLEQGQAARRTGNELYKKGRFEKAEKRYEYAVSCIQDFPGISLGPDEPAAGDNPLAGMGGFGGMGGMGGFGGMPDFGDTTNLGDASESSADEDAKSEAKAEDGPEKEKQKEAAKELAVACLNNLSAVKARRRDFSGVVGNCDKALRVDAANEKALYKRANAKAELGRFDEALADMEKARAAARPHNPLFARRCAELRRKKALAERKVDSLYRRMFEGIGAK